MWSCIMPGLPTYSVQELNVGTVGEVHPQQHLKSLRGQNSGRIGTSSTLD